jgi:hypothetical protein
VTPASTSAIGSAAQLNTAWEDEEQQHRQDRGAGHRVHDERVHVLQRAPARRLRVPGRVQDAAYLALCPLDLLERRIEPLGGRARRRRRQRLEPLEQRLLAAVTDRHRLDHRHAEFLLEAPQVEPEAPVAGKVAHV